MGRTKKLSKSNPDLKVKPILDALQRLAKEFAKTEDGRKKLQQYTGLSKGGLDGLLYLGKGAPSTWLNVFLCIFDLTPELALDAFEGFEATIRKKGRVSEADKQWFAVSQDLDEDSKHYWLSIFEYATRLKKT